MTNARLLLTVPGLARLISAHLGDEAEMVILPEGSELGEWLAVEGSGIRAAIIGGYEPFTDAAFDRLAELRHIAVFGEGMEGLDRAAANRRGVAISNAAGLHAPEVANYAVALLLAARRRVIEGDAWVRQGRWLEARMPVTHAVAGAKVGIVGLGQIGQAIAERVEALGCRVSWWGPTDKPGVAWPRLGSLVGLAKANDVLVVAVRSSDETRGLIDRPVLDALGPEGLLVNVSRGFVVDEAELIAACREGRLGQAALDVFDPEPASPERWKDVPNVLLSPHQGGATIETLDQLAANAVASVRAALAGN